MEKCYKVKCVTREGITGTWHQGIFFPCEGGIVVKEAILSYYNLRGDNMLHISEVGYVSGIVPLEKEEVTLVVPSRDVEVIKQLMEEELPSENITSGVTSGVEKESISIRKRR